MGTALPELDPGVGFDPATHEGHANSDLMSLSSGP
jgi:hypothetical protein